MTDIELWRPSGPPVPAEWADLLADVDPDPVPDLEPEDPEPVGGWRERAGRLAAHPSLPDRVLLGFGLAGCSVLAAGLLLAAHGRLSYRGDSSEVVGTGTTAVSTVAAIPLATVVPGSAAPGPLTGLTVTVGGLPPFPVVEGWEAPQGAALRWPGSSVLVIGVPVSLAEVRAGDVVTFDGLRWRVARVRTASAWTDVMRGVPERTLSLYELAPAPGAAVVAVEAWRIN